MSDETEQAETEQADLATRAPGAYASERIREIRRDGRRSPAAWLSDVRSGERAWQTARRAEAEVGRQLRKLGPGWFVLHSVPLPQRPSDVQPPDPTIDDVDHLVIGPPGVLALTTLDLGSDVVTVGEGTVRRNRRAVDLEGTRAVARRASDRISSAFGAPVEVRPVLVVLAGRLKVLDQHPEVPVVGRRRISTWLMKQPDLQAFERTKRLYALARQEQTWREEPG